MGGGRRGGVAFYKWDGWLVILGLTAFSDSFSVYIEQSPERRKIGEKR